MSGMSVVGDGACEGQHGPISGADPGWLWVVLAGQWVEGVSTAQVIRVVVAAVCGVGLE